MTGRCPGGHDDEPGHDPNTCADCILGSMNPETPIEPSPAIKRPVRPADDQTTPGVHERTPAPAEDVRTGRSVGRVMLGYVSWAPFAILLALGEWMYATVVIVVGITVLIDGLDIGQAPLAGHPRSERRPGALLIRTVPCVLLLCCAGGMLWFGAGYLTVGYNPLDLTPAQGLTLLISGAFVAIRCGTLLARK